jgi:hypothetical protein
MLVQIQAHLITSGALITSLSRYFITSLSIFPSITYTAMDVTVPDPKRRRTRKDKPLMHGDVKAAEAVTFDYVEVPGRRGKVVKPVLVPLLPLQPGEGSSCTARTSKTQMPEAVNQDLPDAADQMDMGQDEPVRNMVHLF